LSDDFKLASLVDYENIRTALEQERNAFVKVNSFSEDLSAIRSNDDALSILNFLEGIHRKLHELFSLYSSLEYPFSKEYVHFNDFISREYILEACFLDDFLFPDNEDFPLTSPADNSFKPEFLKEYEEFIEKYCRDVKDDHEKTQKLIHENFNSKISSKEIPCKCNSCLVDYRSTLRDLIYTESVELIEEKKAEVLELIEENDKNALSVFRELQKSLDKKFYSIRFKLKRSTLNRLESQVKSRLKGEFSYPSPLAGKRVLQIKPYLVSSLLAQSLRRDLVSDGEYERWFSQLGTNIWRGESYLDSEFKKLVKAVLVLKRKDISANILKNYLGEFWAYSNARQIKRKIVYHMGPTNSGKTYHAMEALSKVEKGCYLAPLRLLAAELYDTLNERGVKTTLLTGEEVIEIPDATHYSSTIEMARFNEIFDCCVIDEIQMISDPQRGWAWTRALVNIFSPVVHVCGDPSVLTLVETIVDLCGDELEIVKYDRMTKLEVQKSQVRVGDLQKSDALIVFSRKNALKYKSELERLDLKVSIVYGRLSPEVRREQARKFDQGETDVIVATDAIAMGMNLPIKRIVFSTLTKHINSRSFDISHSEIKQIAGRAGRFKKFPTGYVSCLSKVEDGLVKVNDALGAKLQQKKECMVGPDLDIFNQVNAALKNNGLPVLMLSEFLRLFNTMTFKKPFYCVELKEMIELTEMVEEADQDNRLTSAEIFGFACAPVNLGLIEHVQYFIYILNHYVRSSSINYEPIEYQSDDIDYLETAIKCVELFQWLSRHFSGKNFSYSDQELLENKLLAVDKLNTLLSNKIVKSCASCGVKLDEKSKFAICEDCFQNKRFNRKRRAGVYSRSGGADRQRQNRNRLSNKLREKSSGGPSSRGKKNSTRRTKKTTSKNFKSNR